MNVRRAAHARRAARRRGRLREGRDGTDRSRARGAAHGATPSGVRLPALGRPGARALLRGAARAPDLRHPHARGTRARAARGVRPGHGRRDRPRSSSTSVPAARSRAGPGSRKPRAKQPLQHPFAYALIQLDGADTPLLHAVDALAESRMRTGMRVRPRWRSETKGEIADIACFEPEVLSHGAGEEHHDPRRARLRLRHRSRAEPLPARHRRGKHPRPALHRVPARVRAVARRLRALRACAPRRRSRSPTRARSPRSASCACRPRTSSFNPPYVCAAVLLDGADIPFIHVMQECALEDVRMGMRVQAVWVAEGGARADDDEHPLLQADRRARRRVRHVQGAPVMRDVAIVSFAQSAKAREIAQRDRDPDAGRAGGGEGLEARRAPRSASPARARATTCRARASRSSARSTRSARGRRSRSRTSRWTAPGRCTRPGSRSRPATSTRRWSTRSASRRPATCRDPRAAARPVHRDAALARRATAWPRCRRARSSRRPARASAISREVVARSRRDAVDEPARGRERRGRRREAAGRAVRRARRCARTTCRRSPTARRRGDGRGRARAQALRAAGLDPRHRPPHRAARASACAT